MSTYVVRLVDCAGGIVSQQSAVLALIAPWYRSMAAASGGQWSADVQWQAQPPGATPGQDAGSAMTVNIYLFYVPDPGKSVIKLHPQYRSTTLPAEGDRDVKGTTVLTWTPPAAQPGSRTPVLAISEIYISRCREAADAATQLNLARIGYHESMHNQLMRAETELHTGQGGGFAAEVPTGTAPNPTNNQRMAAQIATAVPQWPDGFQAWRNALNDPLSGWL